MLLAKWEKNRLELLQFSSCRLVAIENSQVAIVKPNNFLQYTHTLTHRHRQRMHLGIAPNTHSCYHAQQGQLQ